MTTRKPNAEDRVMQAHSRLLASVRVTPEMPHAVQDALVREADLIESFVLARLIGRLSVTVMDGKPISASRLAQVVEEMCAKGEQDAADLIAKHTPKEAGQ
jgi:hypothetical protein